MIEQTLQRIKDLDDKQAIFIANNLVQSAFTSTARLNAMDEPQLAALILRGVAAYSAVDEKSIADLQTDQSISEAGAVAKEALKALALAPAGEDILTHAMDTWFDKTADFGLLTGSIACALLWLVITGGIEFKIGSLHVHKPEMTGEQQRRLGEKLIPSTIARILKKSS
jgi:hypothetical protein